MCLTYGQRRALRKLKGHPGLGSLAGGAAGHVRSAEPQRGHARNRAVGHPGGNRRESSQRRLPPEGGYLSVCVAPLTTEGCLGGPRSPATARPQDTGSTSQRSETSFQRAGSTRPRVSSVGSARSTCHSRVAFAAASSAVSGQARPISSGGSLIAGTRLRPAVADWDGASPSACRTTAAATSPPARAKSTTSPTWPTAAPPAPAAAPCTASSTTTSRSTSGAGPSPCTPTAPPPPAAPTAPKSSTATAPQPPAPGEPGSRRRRP